MADIVIVGQGERYIIEHRYQFPGRSKFDAHPGQNVEFGWRECFDVTASR